MSCCLQKSIFKNIRKNLPKRKLPCSLQANRIGTNIPVHSNLANHNSQRRYIEEWTRLVSKLAKRGPNTEQSELALRKASQMLDSGIKPNGYALVHLVRASTDLDWDSSCYQLHCYILRSGYRSDIFVTTALIRFYVKVDSLDDAHKVLVEIPQPSVVCWNSLISGHVHSSQWRKALGLFVQLDRSDICVDAHSLTLGLVACGALNLLQLGRSIHAKIMKCGHESEVVVGNCLIDMYGKCGSAEEAILVFEDMRDKDLISWNSVIAASARNQKLDLAFYYFNQMPNPDTISYNELINGSAQYGNIGDAVRILSNMPKTDSSSWNSIITGYVNRNRAGEALDFFSKMHSSDIKKDEYTYSVILSGIAGLAALTWGTMIHGCTIKCGLSMSIVVGSALIDMYSKCGQVKIAELLFQILPRKNLVTWNAMISGYAHNGDSVKVVELFEQLKTVRGWKPNCITFLNVFAACSHTDMPLDKAISYLESMVNDYGIEPTIEHGCSIIRLLGQKGEVKRAERMIYELGLGSCGVVWRALLGACGACRDLKVAEVAAAKVIEFNGDDDYVYVTLSNIYAYFGKWKEVRLVRKLMSEKGVMKNVGCSWIEVENEIPHSSM